jgi:hypothetical protein
MGKDPSTLDLSRLEMVEEQMVPIYKNKTPQERLKIAFSLWRLARAVILSSFRNQHPDWNEARLQHETARRMSGGAF